MEVLLSALHDEACPTLVPLVDGEVAFDADGRRLQPPVRVPVGIRTARRVPSVCWPRPSSTDKGVGTRRRQSRRSRLPRQPPRRPSPATSTATTRARQPPTRPIVVDHRDPHGISKPRSPHDQPPPSLAPRALATPHDGPPRIPTIVPTPDKSFARPGRVAERAAPSRRPAASRADRGNSAHYLSISRQPLALAAAGSELLLLLSLEPRQQYARATSVRSWKMGRCPRSGFAETTISHSGVSALILRQPLADALANS
jgi:hypothetical protein